MAGFVDVILRGLGLALTAVALGGLVWARGVLRGEPYAKPDAPTALALRLAGGAALGAAVVQLAVISLGLWALAGPGEPWPWSSYLQTTFVAVGIARAVIALGTGALGLGLARRARGALAWYVYSAGTVTLVVASALLSHAMARLENRAVLIGFDAAHQVAAAIWTGGLAHLTLYVAWRRRHLDDDTRRDGDVVRRFSSIALVSVIALTIAGLALTYAYIGEPTGLIGTAYGVMVLSKVALFLATLALAGMNYQMVRRNAVTASTSIFTYVEVELGLVVTVLFAAASLTGLPPARDVTSDRATPAQVAARFLPTVPRLTSPPIGELLRTADPLMARQIERKPVERAWSEYNHHWAGLFVLLMGLLAAAERLGLRPARQWPLVFLALAAFLFVRNDPRAWPLGPAGFWESLVLPDVLQHRAFVLLVIAFGVFEWAVRTERLASRPWGYVFPMLCAAAGGLLLTHSHAMFSLRDEFLIEVTHAPLGILGAFAGWARWLEVRRPGMGRAPAWLWRSCLIGIGALLLVYREA